jgi:hypothetical protein
MTARGRRDIDRRRLIKYAAASGAALAGGAVCGGIGPLEGPIIGVIIFYLMQTNLAGFGGWYLILLGALAIATMLFAPKGIRGHFSHHFGVVLFPVQRRVSLSAPPQEPNLTIGRGQKRRWCQKRRWQKRRWQKRRWLSLAVRSDIMGLRLGFARQIARMSKRLSNERCRLGKFIRRVHVKERV